MDAYLRCRRSVTTIPNTGLHKSLGIEKVQLNHEKVRWEEYYTGHCFAVPELVPGIDRHHGTRSKLNALGGEFIWTLNHEIVFSTALTGRALLWSQYCLKRCVIGTTEEYAEACTSPTWEWYGVAKAWSASVSTCSCCSSSTCSSSSPQSYSASGSSSSASSLSKDTSSDLAEVLVEDLDEDHVRRLDRRLGRRLGRRLVTSSICHCLWHHPS